MLVCQRYYEILIESVVKHLTLQEYLLLYISPHRLFLARIYVRTQMA
jgi:hypothetical protein